MTQRPSLSDTTEPLRGGLTRKGGTNAANSQIKDRPASPKALRRTAVRTSYEQRLWRVLEDVQARVELPEALDKLVTHTLWHDRARLGEPT